MNIILGTVQFGLDYGVTNASGQVNYAEVTNILKVAHRLGIAMLDTSSQYGAAEQVVGKACQSLENKFNVITKTRKLAGLSAIEAQGYIKQDFINSCSQLGQERLSGLLIHAAEDLLGDHGVDIYHALSELKENNKVKNIGVSVYTPEQLEYIIQNYTVDIVQLPLNIFDQRFVSWIDVLRAKNIEVHVRSGFLQGLLLDWASLPDCLKNFQVYFDRYEGILNREGISPLKATLGFVKQYADYFVCGVVSERQLIDICNNLKNLDKKLSDINWQKELGTQQLPQQLIDPRMW